MEYHYVMSETRLRDNGGEIIVPNGGDGYGAWVMIPNNRKGVGIGLPRKLKKKLFGTRKMRRGWEKSIRWFGAKS